MSPIFLTVAAVIAGAGFASAAPQPAGTTANPNTKSSAAAVTNAVASIPQSVFIVPQSSREGRNPFFPNSKWGQDAPKPKERVNATAFVLNGITSPPRRTAMINGRTFEPGERGEVKLADGTKTTITCKEVRDNYAIISVAGELRELHFRAGNQ